MNAASSKIRDWEARLGRRTLLDQVHDAANSVVDPLTADAEACWQATWRIPLYANTTVSNGRAMSERLEPHMLAAWRTWGMTNGAIIVSHLGGRNDVKNFSIDGSGVDIVKACRVAPHRLLAIQGAAAFIRSRVEQDRCEHPFASFASTPLDELVPELISHMGRGWGPITVLHLLTDFGLAVKPDLHLVRTVKSLGLLPSLSINAVPSLADALAINSAVRDLAREIYGEACAPRQLRHLDALLMEASRQRLIAIKEAI